MHPLTALVPVERQVSLLVAAAILPTAALAGDGADAQGPWIFASVAFVAVAVISFLAGSWRSALRQQKPSGEVAAEIAAPEPTAAALVQPLALARLAGSLAADPRPAYLLGPNPNSGERVLLQANAAGLRLLGAGEQAVGGAWAEVEAAAPAALRNALVEPGYGGGWWLLRDEGGSQCLALGPEGQGAEADTASLVYAVSHDLRGPIRVVEGFTRIVKEDYGRELDRVGNDHLDRVLAAGARMNQMIDAVLAMARLASQPLSRQPVDLSQLAAFVVDDLRRGAPERQVEVTIEGGLRARGDPTLLRMVLENLLGNAWKYSGRNPQAKISFSATAEPGAGGSGRPIFAVRDNGAGFDMRVADRLFGLFQRLHSAKDFAGTGVGLASVRRIVQRHGGHVWAQAEPERGAAFFFTLAD